MAAKYQTVGEAFNAWRKEAERAAPLMRANDEASVSVFKAATAAMTEIEEHALKMPANTVSEVWQLVIMASLGVGIHADPLDYLTIRAFDHCGMALPEGAAAWVQQIEQPGIFRN